jgi:hypothetical protein
MTKEQYEKISNRIEELYKIINEGKGYNPYRDSKGRFANGPSAAFGEYAGDVTKATKFDLNDAGFSGSDGDSVMSRIGSTRTKALITTSMSVSNVAKGSRVHESERDAIKKLGDNASALHSVNFSAEQAYYSIRDMAENLGRAASYDLSDSRSRDHHDSAKEFFRRESKAAASELKGLESKIKSVDKFKDVAPKTVKKLKDEYNVFKAAFSTLSEIGKSIDSVNALEKINLKK